MKIYSKLKTFRQKFGTIVLVEETLKVSDYMYCMIEIAFDNLDEVKQTISKLLNEKLVASCQMIESNSKWNWKQEQEESKEYLVFMKTKKSLQKKIYEIIKEIHSYDCFEFAVFDLTSCNQDYLNWIEEETI